MFKIDGQIVVAFEKAPTKTVVNGLTIASPELKVDEGHEKIAYHDLQEGQTDYYLPIELETIDLVQVTFDEEAFK